MKVANYGEDHPHAIVRGRVAGWAAVGTATLSTVGLNAISPAQLTANTDNWNPTGLATGDKIRVTTDASRNLTGIVAPSVNRLVILENIGAFDLVLVHDATSTAANRFLCPDDVDLTLPPDSGVFLQYDVASARWRVLGAVGTTGDFELNIEGGQDVVSARGTLGATETIDPTLGSVITGTLDQNCVLTIDPPVGSGASTLEFWFTEDGTGGWVPSFTASGGGTFSWDGGTPSFTTTAGTTFRVILERIPGTTNDWIGSLVGGAAAGAMVPYYIGASETFTVPLYRQGLFAMTIDVIGMLVVDGYLIGVT